MSDNFSLATLKQALSDIGTAAAKLTKAHDLIRLRSQIENIMLLAIRSAGR